MTAIDGGMTLPETGVTAVVAIEWWIVPVNIHHHKKKAPLARGLLVEPEPWNDVAR
jgi:hypothetical protein